MSLRSGAALGMVAFGASLAYFVFNSMSADAINVAVGLLCGVIASLPVSLGLLVALTRRRDPTLEEREDSDLPAASALRVRKGQMPQVIVIAPPYSAYQTGTAPYGYPGDNRSAYESDDLVQGRDWKIIGDDR